MASETEERSYGEYTQGRSSIGRTVVYIVCPFCRTEVTAYLWSLCGSGKRCSCGAKFDGYGFARRAVTGQPSSGATPDA